MKLDMNWMFVLYFGHSDSAFMGWHVHMESCGRGYVSLYPGKDLRVYNENSISQ